MTSTVASAIRPGLRDYRTASGSPHTPSRFISSNFSSPGSSFRQEEDAVIIEVNPRFVSAGYEGESGPQCVVPFGPKRREGDYRTYLPGYQRRRVKDLDNWSNDYELWQNDVAGLDLDLLEDKLGKAFRDVYNNHLLIDAGNARLILVLPSLVPHPVLSAALFLLFERWKFPSISLLSSPTTATVAAGLRSALVIDISWEETVITPIYEYRELRSWRSSRGMKALTNAFARMLMEVIDKQPEEIRTALRFDLDFVEEIIGRIAHWKNGEEKALDSAAQVAELSLDDKQKSTKSIVVDWPTSHSSEPISISPDLISDTVSSIFLDKTPDLVPDDNELPLSELLYKTLLNLSFDIRSVVLPRIVFVGAGSEIPGLRVQILSATRKLITTCGWTGVRGTHYKPTTRNGLMEVAQVRTIAADFSHSVPLPVAEKDYAEERVRKLKVKEADKSASVSPLQDGVLGEVETLGPWAGASLMTTVKVRGLVEVERERYLSHGLNGASRDSNSSISAGQRSVPVDGQAKKNSERSGWTLGVWA